MVIGGIWCPRDLESSVRARLAEVRKSHNLYKEVKWRKVSGTYLAKYQDFTGVFFEHPALLFNCIVVDRNIIDYGRYHNNDKKVAFNKFYFQLLSRKTLPNHFYWVFPDHQANRESDPLPSLRTIINNYHLREHGCSPIRQIEPRSSENDDLIQLADVFTGAVQGAWNQTVTRPAKIQLCNFIAQKAGLRSLNRATGASVRPVNIWCWRPRT